MSNIKELDLRFELDGRVYSWRGGYLKTCDSKERKFVDTKYSEQELIKFKNVFTSQLEALLKETKLC